MKAAVIADFFHIRFMLLKISPTVFLTRRGRGIEERSAFSAERVVCSGGPILSKTFNVSSAILKFFSYDCVFVHVQLFGGRFIVFKFTLK